MRGVTPRDDGVKTDRDRRQRRVNAPLDRVVRAGGSVTFAPRPDRGACRKDGGVADLLYALVVLAVFAVLLLAVRGLDRL